MPLRPPRFVRRFISFVMWHQRDREMEREMTFHVESLTRDLMASGMTEDEARATARRRFGSMLQLKEEGHDIRTGRLFDGVTRDARHMARGLRKSPVFTLTVVLTLALAVGGNTAIFSIVDQLLLRPLPYPNGDQLVTANETFITGNITVPGLGRTSASPANWLDWQREAHTFESFAAWRAITATLTGVGDPVRLNVQQVSVEFFPLLGVAPLLGRIPIDTDDRPNAPGVAVLSYQLWQRRFGGDPNVIGRVVQMSDRPTEIIGIMPASFRFIQQDIDVWAPFRLDRNAAWRKIAGRFIQVVARVRPGVTVAAARADLEGVAARLAATHDFNKNTSVKVLELRKELSGAVESSLIVLYAAVGVLLAIACFNVANLLLARAAARKKEIALRTSLGAGRWAIVRQLIVESLLLAIAGGILGVFFARWSLAAVMAFAPADMIRVPELRVDQRVLFYALAVSVLTGLVVGLAPALLAARQSIISSLRASGSSVTQSSRLRHVLVVAQVAMTVVLLCGAGLLIRTVIALHQADNGFDRRDLLTMEIALPGVRYAPDQRTLFYRNAVAALRALPGVQSAAAGNSLPVIGGPRGGTIFHRLGTPELPMNDRPSATIRVVAPGYFRSLGVPVLQGREFIDADDATPTPGFLVNEAFAKTFLKDVDPLAVTMAVWMQAENPYAPILGVVGDVTEGGVRASAEPTIFYSNRQLNETAMTLFLRASRPESHIASAVAALHRLDPNLAVSRIQTFDDAISESLARDRLSAMVLAAFAGCALLLASLGLYGLLAYVVTERTKEIAIRMALGARVAELRRRVIGEGMMMVAGGATLGIIGSLVLLRAMRSILFGVQPQDALTYLAVVGLLAIVTVAASYLPARKASRIEPLIALRQD